MQQVLLSAFKPLCPVVLPEFKGRQHYMHKFDLCSPSVPEGFEDFFEVVNDLVASSGVTEGVAYLTVDEQIIPSGRSQRRPGPHVDGCYIPSQGRWGHGGWVHVNKILRMPVIVAASKPGCVAYTGEFIATPTEVGDLSHMKEELGAGEMLPANQGFMFSPDCVHESVVYDETTTRTFVRIAMPVGSYH